jgi:hypothetical protein
VEDWQMAFRVGSLSIIHHRVSFSILALFFLPTLASAQVGTTSKVQMQEMSKRELQLSDLSKGNNKELNPKRAQAIKEQVNEDFYRILILHNDMVHAIDDKSPLDYQFITNASGEINKRATRLQSMLVLGPADQPEPNRPHLADSAALSTKDDLIKLCRKIELFIQNPIIDTPGTIDAHQLVNARRDLQSVIELSSAIKKGAAKQKTSLATIYGEHNVRVHAIHSVESFYTSPLKAPMDPDYSELDFEYLSVGGWGSVGPTLYATSWRAFSTEPNST